MENYYTVYDLTPSDGSLSVGLAQKNPDYGADPILPQLVKDHATVIACSIIAVILLIAAACFYRKKKKDMDTTVVFETYKQYDFGDIKSQKITSDKLLAR
jgi:hypothetical protein